MNRYQTVSLPFFLSVSASRDNIHELCFWSTLFPQLLPFEPLLTVFGCCWVVASLSICSSFCWRLLFDRKIIFLLWWSSHYLTPSGEEQGEAPECLVLYMQSWGTAVMHKVKCNFFTSKLDGKGDVSRMNFHLICCKQLITYLGNKSISECGLACSFCIMIFSKWILGLFVIYDMCLSVGCPLLIYIQRSADCKTFADLRLHVFF